MPTENKETIESLVMRCESHAIKQAEKDMLFSGLAPLAKLSEDDKRTICAALKIYAAHGAGRAVQLLAKEGLL